MGKWIEFDDQGPTKSGKTRVWHIINKEYGSMVGVVKWDAGWRKYVFWPGSEFAIYEQDCLRDIATFIETKTREHKEAKVKA